MSKGHFVVDSKTKLSDLEIGAKLNTSDYATLTSEGVFVQLKYVEPDEAHSEKYRVKPGTWTIKKNMSVGYYLEQTSFTDNTMLDSFANTKEIVDKVDCFFNNLDEYRKWGFEIPKKGVLLYGPAGSGKSSAIKQLAKQYVADGKTSVITWDTTKFEAYEVKDFVKSFEYTGVDKLILVVEDLGGVELSEAKRPSDAALLALLDNQEKTFSIPVLIIATTNFPEMFMENLTNRPERFDDLIEVGYPNSDQRKELLKFFFSSAKEPDPTEEDLALIGSKACDSFTPAHIKSALISSRIYKQPMKDSVDKILKNIEKYKKQFQNRKGVSFLHD